MTSKLFTRTAISLISISMLLMSNTVFAKWEMVVTNNSTMPVTASRAVKANSTVTDFVGLGAAGVSIEFPFGVGFIQMTDLGRTNNSSNLPSWGVKICHYHEVKEFYYEGGGK
ncbi:MAG TPA: hypothetical protein DIS98_08255, partial [Colwellia sp.]|nr:hypothetical protein [Colwellia sp.]